MTTDIIVENVNKSFGNQKVLVNRSMKIHGPGITCLMGPSGCGKTTLMRILMGLEQADSGTVTGIDRKNIGAVFQEDRLLEEEDAIVNIRLAASKRTTGEIEEHLKAVKLTDYAGKPVAQLSGGMRRRIAIVRAVMADNTVLFLDEPLKGLDEATKTTVMEYIRDHTQERTVLMITHEEREAEWFGGPIIRMSPAE